MKIHYITHITIYYASSNHIFSPLLYFNLNNILKNLFSELIRFINLIINIKCILNMLSIG